MVAFWQERFLTVLSNAKGSKYSAGVHIVAVFRLCSDGVPGVFQSSTSVPGCLEHTHMGAVFLARELGTIIILELRRSRAGGMPDVPAWVWNAAVSGSGC